MNGGDCALGLNMERAGGSKKARAATASSSIDHRSTSIRFDRQNHSKSLIRKWLDCPLEQGLKDALRRDLEEIYQDEDLTPDIDGEWVDCDENVFGSGSDLIKNPFEGLDVEEISARLPNASYVKAGMIKENNENKVLKE